MALVDIDITEVFEHAQIATITLNRPDKKNAMNDPLQRELTSALRDVAGRGDVRVVVLTGAGGDFCSGGDLWGKSDDPVRRSPTYGMQRLNSAASALHHVPQPVIAKVRGVAVGAGCNLAFGCDLVVAAETARFSEIFSRRGVVPDFGGSWLLPRKIGLHKAKELAFFGDILSATEALEWGLINRVVVDDQLDSFVDDWARKLVAGPPLALAVAKQLLNNSTSISFDQALDGELVAQTYMFSTNDSKEAAAAFVEKRTPNFKGR